MYIIDVIPLTKLPFSFSQSFIYFSKQKIEKGALVLVSIGRRETMAFVENSTPLEKRKIEIKKGAFVLKKIQKVIVSEKTLTINQFKLAKWFSSQYITPLGPVLKLFLPQTLIKRKTLLKAKYPSFSWAKQEQKSKKKIFLLWQEKRWEFYKKEIKKSLTKRRQVLFLSPEISITENLEEKIKNFFSYPKEKISVIQGNFKTSEELSLWQKIGQGKIKLIFGTRSALFLPFQNLDLIIVDQEENLAYESWDKQPRYNVKTIALKLAEISGAKIILGTKLPTIESYYYAKKAKYDLIKDNLSEQNHNLQIIDMKEETRKGNFSIFSERLTGLLKKTVSQKKQAVLFINRRGFSTVLLCQECGFISRCKNCEASLVLHLKQRNSILLCHHCGYKEAPPTICPNCQGWQIKGIGKGTQKVFEELKKILPKTKILRLDSDIAPCLKKQKSIINDFKNKKASILVATQLLLKFSNFFNCHSHFQTPSLAIIVLIDSMLNFPEFRSRERVFQILKKFQSFGKKMLLQTYNPELSIFQYLKKNKIEDFFNEELNQRQKFFYPPFAEIIRLTYFHKNSETAEIEAQKTKERISKSLSIQGQTSGFQTLGPAPGFIPKIKNKCGWQIVIKLKNEKRKKRKEILKAISPGWTIEVNPKSLL